MVVTPTTSQCQSSALAVRPRYESGNPGGHKSRPPGSERRDHRQRQPDEKKRKAHQSELRERLEVERVPVSDDESDRPPLVPEVLERARAVPGRQLLVARVPRDPQLLASPVPRDVEEPLVEVCSRDGVTVEPIAKLGHTPNRASDCDQTTDDGTGCDRDENEVERPPRAPVDGDAPSHDMSSEGEEGGTGGQDDDDESQSMTLSLPLRRDCVLTRERLLA